MKASSRLAARGFLAAACAAAAPAGAAIGDSLWKFYADFAVTVVAPMPDVSGNGGLELLVGSQDDSLYLVEARGPAAGNQHWIAPFKSTLSAAAALPDLNGDGKADAVAGDQLGLVQALSGADGKPLWKFLTFGTALSLAALPDVNGDGAADVALGSENDTVYCLSGKPGSTLGKSVWEFPVPPSKHGPPVDPPKPLAKTALGSPFDTRPSGANSVALLPDKGKAPFGLAVGTNNDTVYCLGLADGAPKWKTELPGDVWQVAAFPDEDGDGVDEVLAACGANAGYLLNGATGAIVWSHAVKQGATAVAATADMDGDGKADALIGDGDGTVHCVSGKAKGADVPAVWAFSFGDVSTIMAIAVPGDLDKDGRADCVVGTSNDTVAAIGGKGNRLWVKGLEGQVNAVSAPGDLDGNGVPDWIAGTEMGYAQAFSGGGISDGVAARAFPPAPARARAYGPSPLFRKPGSASGASPAVYDARGRAAIPPEARP